MIKCSKHALFFFCLFLSVCFYYLLFGGGVRASEKEGSRMLFVRESGSVILDQGNIDRWSVSQAITVSTANFVIAH